MPPWTWAAQLHSPPKDLRLSTLTCKTQQYHASSCSNDEPWRSHSTAICRHWLAKHNRTTSQRLQHLQPCSCSSKSGSRRQSGKTTIWKHFFKSNFKRKIITAKIEKICCQSTFHTSHAAIPMRFATQLQNATVSRMQLQHRRTLTQPFHCDLKTLTCKTQ